MANVCIAGSGYVGLVTGACLAELGHTVSCVEIDAHRLAALARGELPIHEPGLDELVQRHYASGRLTFTRDFSQAVPEAEVSFITVSTPPMRDGRADTSAVFSATRSILRHARLSSLLIVKSTVPVGTGDALASLVVRAGRRDIDVVSNPEFLRQGSAVVDCFEPDRIVIGAPTDASAEAVARLYRTLRAPVITCSRRSAELAKYVANAFLAIRISLMNEVAELCEALDADVTEVAAVVGADRRIGPAYLSAGLGWGGSCLPKDSLALASMAADEGQPAGVLEAAMEANVRQRERAFDLLCQSLDSFPNPTVGVLGLAFKPDTDDIRGSPALDIIERLLRKGIRVRAHDPAAIAKARRAQPAAAYCSDAYGVALGSDALLLATEWEQYCRLDWRRMRSLMRGRFVLDGRNALDGDGLAELGFQYRAFGRPAPRAAITSLLSEEVPAAGGS